MAANAYAIPPAGAEWDESWPWGPSLFSGLGKVTGLVQGWGHRTIADEWVSGSGGTWVHRDANFKGEGSFDLQ